MDTFAIFAEGLSGLEADFKDRAEQVELFAVQAINKAARDGRSNAATRILREVAFPKSYLSPGAGRLRIARQAQRGRLEAAIAARSRPTSLARFITGTSGKSGVTVQVTPGKTQTLAKAFLVNLRSGVDGLGNKGLAVRLKPGESLRNKTRAVQLRRNLYLLYGPSVDQAFLNNAGKGVAADITPQVLEDMENEFLRLARR